MTIFGKTPERRNPLKTMATDEEKARVEEAAKRLGMSVAELIRLAIDEYVDRHEKTKKSR